jgi:hypothetical protein
VDTEEDLHSIEVRHLCPEKVLADLLAQEKAIEARAARN